jgi:putative DNA-invertase from lambdoid prophage Rac
MKLLDRLERDDVLVVTKLDRLGRNSIDVQTPPGWTVQSPLHIQTLIKRGYSNWQ